MAHVPTRTFTVVVDPYSLDVLAHDRRLLYAFALVDTLADFAPPITIQLVFPAYLATASQLASVEGYFLPFTLFSDEVSVPQVALSRHIPGRLRGRIERGAEDECRSLRLLSLAEHLKADGILTESPALLDARYELLVRHKFRIIPLREFADFIEVCGRGHGVPCSVVPAHDIPWDLLYVFTHWKCRRLAGWLNAVSSTLTDTSLRELLRSAILNRYPFIITARDYVRFYELQTHHCFRHTGQRGEFRMSLNYHLTSFYLHVWGMLDALTGIANLRLGLGLSARQCGITSDAFLDAIRHERAPLSRFIKHYGPRWVSVMGDVRHPAAHSAIRIQRELLEETQESRKSDEEIIAILKVEDPIVWVTDEAYTRHLLPTAIYLWRVRHMTVVTDDAIYVEDPSGSYFRPAVTSIDADLEMLNAFVDAFLFSCFAGA